ncbi:MAG: trigger factor [Cycloclasticus sp. symbiont of Poecilosclerida sp. M]|nr:MAG: trigger factor [Cycloclasticus sp. symbiont of Poecilosclerida sp. M]
MQVSVESGSDLKKTMTVVVPQEDVDTAVNKRLEEARRNVRIDGFRPGKVPMSVVKSKFGAGIKAEALSELTQSFYYKAIVQEKITPAGPPEIKPNDEVEEGYSFSATFETYPEIKVNSIEKLKIDRPTVEIASRDVDAMIEKLRLQKMTWKTSKGKSKDGNRVVINFEGKVNDKPVSDDPIKSFPVILGSKSMIQGFEDNLTGISTGDVLSFDATFPEEYAQPDFAGQVGHFDVTVEKIEVSELPEVDSTFIKEFGVESGKDDDFRADLKKNMSLELENLLAAKRKQIVMDAIVADNEVQLPSAMVDSEINQMMASMKEQAKQAQQEQADLPKELFEEQARKRVKLGLLLAEIIKQNDIKSDDKKVTQKIEEFASTYESPEEVINWYSTNEKERSKVESVVLEEQLVDFVLEKAKVTEKTMSFDEIMNPAAPAV